MVSINSSPYIVLAPYILVDKLSTSHGVERPILVTPSIKIIANQPRMEMDTSAILESDLKKMVKQQVKDMITQT